MSFSQIIPPLPSPTESKSLSYTSMSLLLSHNICKSINVIYHISKLKNKNDMIISIDAEKAFDNIQHPFMIKTLQKSVITFYLKLLLYEKGAKKSIIRHEAVKVLGCHHPILLSSKNPLILYCRVSLHAASVGVNPLTPCP